MPAYPIFPAAALESICQVLGAVEGGLTHQEIGRLLQQLGIEEPVPGLNKWKRLASALGQRQAADRCGNKVIEAIMEAMRPVRFTSRHGLFEERRAALNGVLVFSGLELRSDGNLAQAATARTLDEAQQRAGHLRAELVKRNVHPEVLKFCRAERCRTTISTRSWKPPNRCRRRSATRPDSRATRASWRARLGTREDRNAVPRL